MSLSKGYVSRQCTGADRDVALAERRCAFGLKLQRAMLTLRQLGMSLGETARDSNRLKAMMATGLMAGAWSGFAVTLLLWSDVSSQ